MSHMQPEVSEGVFYEVETECGTTVVSSAVVSSDVQGIALPEGGTLTPDDAGFADAAESLRDYAEGEDIREITATLGWGARLSASVPWSVYETEEEAWAALIDDAPESFCWSVDYTANDEPGGTPVAHIYLDSEAAASAMKAAIQSVDGSNLEQDGDFLYVAISDPERAAAELRDAGFEVCDA